MFGKFNPDFEMQEISRINFKYLHSDEFKIIKQEEEKYVLEKWQYLKQFLKSKEVEECIEKAEKQLALYDLQQIFLNLFPYFNFLNRVNDLYI